VTVPSEQLHGQNTRPRALKIDCASAKQFEQPFEHEEKLAAATKRQQELDAFVSKAGATTNVSGANGLCKKLDGSMVVTRQPFFRLVSRLLPKVVN